MVAGGTNEHKPLIREPMSENASIEINQAILRRHIARDIPPAARG